MHVLTKNQLLSLATIVAGMMAALPEHTDLIAKVLVESTNCAKSESRDQKQLNKLLAAEEFVALCDGKNLLEVIANTPEGEDPAVSLQKLYADMKSAGEEVKPSVELTEGSTMTAESAGVVATLTVTSVTATPEIAKLGATLTAVAEAKKAEAPKRRKALSEIMREAFEKTWTEAGLEIPEASRVKPAEVAKAA